MTDFPRGSEWRKWDLHLHAPGTKLNDGYGTPVDWDRFCEKLESSDVAVFGITDYFSLDSYFDCVDEFEKRYPDSEKVFFPNLEVRLNESVNGDQQLVDLHLLLKPGIDRDKVNQLLSELKTELTEPGKKRQRSCAELSSATDFKRATVSRASVEDAIEKTFGKGSHREEDVMIVVPAGNNGIRAESGQQRKANLADEIDRLADAAFGSERNTEYFLNRDRSEDAAMMDAKPVFSGCDAHSFEQLDEWLGKEITDEASRKTVTWIKADPNFEGLRQTLIEPSERVRIQAQKPDAKEPYKVIDAVQFGGTNDFPAEIVLNQNLVSIIGSRSSGKSALLAYIAHAVDPQYAIAQQVAVDPHATAASVGPAAALTWEDVANIKCSVKWAAPDAETGRVIYIPQNSLFAISERPKEITSKIQPALHRQDPAFQIAHEQMLLDVQTANAEIRRSVDDWFRISAQIDAARLQLADLGDKKAIEATRDHLAQQIEALRAESSLSKDESDEYQKVVDGLAKIDSRIRTIESEAQLLAVTLTKSGNDYLVSDLVGVEIDVNPPLAEFPSKLAETVQKLVAEARGPLTSAISEALVQYQKSLDSERSELANQAEEIKSANAELIAKNQANAEIEALVKSKAKQEESLANIDGAAARVSQSEGDRDATIENIKHHLQARAESILGLAEVFNSKDRIVEPMAFGIESQIEPESMGELSERFNMKEIGDFVDREQATVLIDVCQGDPGQFLRAVSDGTQKIKKGQEKPKVCADVLCASPAVRFFAEIDGDRIGGFQASSMTPGKQALFALSLILDESEEMWPLLVDQPEDDLDSRSIYDVLVEYLKRRKQERQIIMVSHNANLVVGADSEQVIVANRHGADRKNKNDQAFDYMTGSLEHTMPRKDSEIILEVGGIREHACDLLDGGEDAFRKRQEKYKI